MILSNVSTLLFPKPKLVEFWHYNGIKMVNFENFKKTIERIGILLLLSQRFRTLLKSDFLEILGN